MNVSCRVKTDSLQHINQVCVRINILQTAIDQQTVDNRNMLCTRFRPTKKPALSSHWDTSQ